jgi:hypothetical protein
LFYKSAYLSLMYRTDLPRPGAQAVLAKERERLRLELARAIDAADSPALRPDGVPADREACLRSEGIIHMSLSYGMYDACGSPGEVSQDMIDALKELQ